jgi:hypothetical protein
MDARTKGIDCDLGISPFAVRRIPGAEMSTNATTTYHSIPIEGMRIFYREAGPESAPTILLLHGFPSSSRMFATLIPLLADRYHTWTDEFAFLSRPGQAEIQSNLFFDYRTNHASYPR